MVKTSAYFQLSVILHHIIISPAFIFGLHTFYSVCKRSSCRHCVNRRPTHTDFVPFYIFRSYKYHRLNRALDFNFISSSEVFKIFFSTKRWYFHLHFCKYETAAHVDGLTHLQHTPVRLTSGCHLNKILLLDKSNTIQINRIVTNVLIYTKLITIENIAVKLLNSANCIV